MRNSILIVDDNEEILEFLSEVLIENYDTHVAINANTALQILDNNIINLVIADIMMPGMDGFELCQLIKSKIEYCHIPVILLTSKNTHTAHIEGLEVGADAYVTKPFSTDLLQLQIANLLKNRSKIKEHFSSSPLEKFWVMAHSKTDEQFLKKLEEYIHNEINDPNLDIDELAEYMNMSRPTFYRKIKSLSSVSPKELIDITRLKKAAELIAQNEYTLFEITKKVGYSSQSVFGKNFQRYFNLTPTEYMATLKKI